MDRCDFSQPSVYRKSQASWSYTVKPDLKKKKGKKRKPKVYGFFFKVILRYKYFLPILSCIHLTLGDKQKGTQLLSRVCQRCIVGKRHWSSAYFLVRRMLSLPADALTV